MLTDTQIFPNPKTRSARRTRPTMWMKCVAWQGHCLDMLGLGTPRTSWLNNQCNVQGVVPHDQFFRRIEHKDLL